MKKLLILMLVLGLASTANAAIITFDASAQPVCPGPATHVPGGDRDVLPGGVVVVQVTADTTLTSSYSLSIMQTTTSGAGNATATGVGALHATLQVNRQNGNLRNMMTNSGGTPRFILIDRISGGLNAPATIPAGQVLYQFELLIPAGAVFCDLFTIDAALGLPFVTPPPGGYSHTLDGAIPATNTLTLHVVPEPATLALFGLGSLFLMRRRRK